MVLELQSRQLQAEAKMAASAQGSAGAVPSSPRRCRAKVEYMEPPSPPRRRTKPPLLKAIERGSIAQVRAVLDPNDRDARIRLLAADGVEPALCCALRTGQGEKMVRALLQYGADASELVIQGRCASHDGRSALGLLCGAQSCQVDSEESKGKFAALEGVGVMGLSPPSFYCEDHLSFLLAGLDSISLEVPDPVSSLLPDIDFLAPRAASKGLTEAQQIRVGTVLLAAGADPLAPDLTGATPAMLARKSGKLRLACLVEYYNVAQVMFIIGRVLNARESQQRKIPPVGSIGEGILRTICGFLAPEGSDATLARIGALLQSQGTSPRSASV